MSERLIHVAGIRHQCRDSHCEFGGKVPQWRDRSRPTEALRIGQTVGREWLSPRALPAARGQDANGWRQRAFTLIELILVMTVLVIAVSVVAPALAGFFRGRALDLEARRLLALVHAGQSRAVSEGFPVLLWVDASQHAYGLAEETTARDGDPKALDFTVEDNVRIDAVNAAPVPVNGRRLPAIRFLPDGSIDEFSPGALRLAGADGSTVLLAQSADHANYEIRKTSQP